MKKDYAKRYISILATFIVALFSFIFLYESKPLKMPSRGGAFHSLKMMDGMRSYSPETEFNEAAYYTAWEKYYKPNINKSTNADKWQSMGPINLGGRTLCIAINPQNPNTIYAGSASGGLWRSYSGGKGADAWKRVWTGFPVLAVSSIAISAQDSNMIFIGTGEVYDYRTQCGIGGAVRTARGTFGIGILKTTDGGDTWKKSLDWSYEQKEGVQAVRLNPLNQNTVWAATTKGTYKSVDGGETWSRKHSVIMANDLVVNPVDTNIIAVAYGNFDSNGQGIYRTTDGGQTWTKAVGGPSSFYGKVQLSLYNSDPNIMFASFGGGEQNSWLCSSNDGGANWSIINTTDYAAHQGWFSHDVAVNPLNPNSMFVVGVDAYKSHDGGASINVIATRDGYEGQVPPEGPEGPSNYMHHDYHDIVYHPTDTSIVYFASDGGVFRTLDGGSSFESLNSGYQTSQFYFGFSSSQTDSNLALGGFQDNASAIYDGNKAWRVRYLSVSDGSWTAVHPENDSILFASKQWAKIYKSTNKGHTWSPIFSPPWGSMAFIAPFVISPSEPNIMYAGTEYVNKSTDGGVNWTKTNNGETFNKSGVYGMAISKQSSDVLYMTTIYGWVRPSVWRTLDGGDNWTDLTSDLPNRYFTAIAVDPTNDANVYVVLSGFGTSHCFRSTNSGETWIDVGEGLPDVPTNAVILDPQFPNNVYVGNDLGVYFSSDSGKTWQYYSEGLNEAAIAMDFSISPTNRMLRIATHGNGAYQRKLASIPTSIEHEESAPSNFVLKQNYPNPFNPSTTIEFILAKPSEVSITIYNEVGERITSLINNQFKSAGYYEVKWKPKNISSGIYFYRLEAGDFVDVKKMMLLK